MNKIEIKAPLKVDDLILLHSDQDFIDKFLILYSLKVFLSNCIIAKDYNFENLSSHSIKLSSEGLKLLQKLKTTQFPSLDNSLLKLAVFLEFYQNALLIDIASTDTNSLLSSISNDITRGQIIYPWIYGRILYDKFFAEFDEQSDKLDNEKAINFLKGTPNGVFSTW